MYESSLIISGAISLARARAARDLHLCGRSAGARRRRLLRVLVGMLPPRYHPDEQICSFGERNAVFRSRSTIGRSPCVHGAGFDCLPAVSGVKFESLSQISLLIHTGWGEVRP